MLSSRRKKDEKFTEITNILAAHQILVKQMIEYKIKTYNEYNNSEKKIKDAYSENSKDYLWYYDKEFNVHLLKKTYASRSQHFYNNIFSAKAIKYIGQINNTETLDKVLLQQKQEIPLKKKKFGKEAVKKLEKVWNTDKTPPTIPSATRAATVAEQAKNIMNAEQDKRKNWFTKITSRMSSSVTPMPQPGGKKKKASKKVSSVSRQKKAILTPTYHNLL